MSKDHFGAQQQAYDEAKVLRSIEHPGVCKLFDTYEDSDNICLVLEYIEGHELFDEIGDDMPPDESRIAEIMRQLLTTLEFCHGPEHSIVHRDIKPENIMITETPSESNATAGPALQVKLIDFGVAAKIGQEIDGVVGTRPYLPPEALAETGFCCPSLDMWSLGVVLYACLLGELPPSGVRAGRCHLDLTDSIWDRNLVSAFARDLVAGLLQVDPAQRLSATQALQHPWIRCAGSVS
jgi:serine/threonine protein kinase